MVDKVEVEERKGKSEYTVIGEEPIACRILMTPYLVKKPVEVVGRTFKHYEDQYGSIEKEPEARREPEVDYIR
jgi:hypothetical protein